MRAATRRSENAVRRPDADCVLHAILGSCVVVWADAGVSGQHWTRISSTVSSNVAKISSSV